MLPSFNCMLKHTPKGLGARQQSEPVKTWVLFCILFCGGCGLKRGTK